MAERRYGIPRTDVERAMLHYGISEDVYCASPEAYPLPSRGAGLTRIAGITIGSTTISWGWIVAAGALAYLVLRRKGILGRR